MSMELKNYFFKPTRFKRFLFFLLSDLIIIFFSFYLSFLLRFGFVFPNQFKGIFVYWSITLLFFKVLLLLFSGLYNISWRFVGLTELLSLFKVSGLSLFFITFIDLVFIRPNWVEFDIPVGIIIIDTLISFSLIGVLRLSKRIYIQIFKSSNIGKRVLIIGADYIIEKLLKEFALSKEEKLYPIVIIDEDKMKIGTRISGIPVLGGFDKIQNNISKFNIECVLINLPRVSHKKIRELFDIIKPLNVEDIRVVPRVNDYDREVLKSKTFKQIAIEDLLSREPIKVDFLKIKNYLKDRVILITGGAGSIGSEIVRQLIRLEVKKIIVFEIDETEVFNLEIEISKLKNKNQEIIYIIGDIRDKNKLEVVFNKYNPQVVFHAAAYKHVPLMESFPEEAVKTNILGTLNVVSVSKKFSCEKFINISTDKAVNPSSIMGATKRMAEIICNLNNSEKSQTISVRFGNVLGSRGSVIPIFLEQIRNGGPVCITHKDIKRYFMSIQEAVLLVMEASLLGNGGEVFVLDMGTPIKIVDLAENLIYLNNLIPHKEIDIIFTGLRPGEKLFEELLTAEEGTNITTHEKIFVANNNSNFTLEELTNMIGKFQSSINNVEDLTSLLKDYVPFYVKKK